MARGCFLLQVKPELVEEYRKAHTPVAEDMLAAIHDSGIKNYSLFLRDDGLLIGYLEGDDLKKSLAQIGTTEANARWQQRMAPYFESGSGDMEKGSLFWVDEIFHIE
jgi:L-rhamnose mutarotase